MVAEANEEEKLARARLESAIKRFLQLASAPLRVPRDAQVENEPDMATLRGPGPRPREEISWCRSAGGLQEVCRRRPP